MCPRGPRTVSAQGLSSPLSLYQRRLGSLLLGEVIRGKRWNTKSKERDPPVCVEAGLGTEAENLQSQPVQKDRRRKRQRTESGKESQKRRENQGAGTGRERRGEVTLTAGSILESLLHFPGPPVVFGSLNDGIISTLRTTSCGRGAQGLHHHLPCVISASFHPPCQRWGGGGARNGEGVEQRGRGTKGEAVLPGAALVSFLGPGVFPKALAPAQPLFLLAWPLRSVQP